ncbi:hypothetical protein ACIPRL_08075 [Streptomyces sp. NPDC090085]|uniref:hypothetical protein n=1 Tax=Streptomyces sp. NPDC090085 TaxID=3365943 RepID=UPI003808813B
MPTIEQLTAVYAVWRRLDELRADDYPRTMWAHAARRRKALADGDPPAYEGEEDDVVETLARHSPEPVGVSLDQWAAHYRDTIATLRDVEHCDIPGVREHIQFAEQRLAAVIADQADTDEPAST